VDIFSRYSDSDLIYFTILATVYIFQNGNLSIESILNIYTVATTISFLLLLIWIKYKRGLDIVSKISIQKIKYIASQIFLPCYLFYQGLTIILN